MKIPMVLARNKGGEISEIQKSIPFWIWHSMMYMILWRKKILGIYIVNNRMIYSADKYHYLKGSAKMQNVSCLKKSKIFHFEECKNKVAKRTTYKVFGTPGFWPTVSRGSLNKTPAWSWPR